MGKKPSSKRKGEQSLHSRAARRETSPSIDTDKSLKNIGLPGSTSNHTPGVLSVHRGAGIVKASKRGRKTVLSAKARRRQEKGFDRAEAILDRTALKVEKSKGRVRKVQERRKAWEDLNKKISPRLHHQEVTPTDKENVMQVEQDAKQDEAAVPHLENDVLSGLGGIQLQSPPSLENQVSNSWANGDEDEIL